MVPQEFQTTVNSYLKKFFTDKKQKLVQYDLRLGELVDQITDVTLRGGDRMRPYFCWLGYHAGGGTDLKQILPAILALELIQSYALIHDDIMDKADRRRGGLTIHAYFTQNLRKPTTAFSLAILAGDLCNLWAHELFNQINNRKHRHSGKSGLTGRIQNPKRDLEDPGQDPLNGSSQDDNLNQVRQLFIQMQEEVISGQTMDVWGMQFGQPESLLKMYQLKSASYTVEKPLLLGVSLARDSLKPTPEIYKTLSFYGQKVGLAFQLRDDYLGVFGDEKITGKSTTGDLKEHKWTFLTALTWEKLTPASKTRFKKIFGQNIKPADILRLKNLIRQSGADKELLNLMQKVVNEAKKSIEEAKLKNQRELISMARFAIERDF